MLIPLISLLALQQLPAPATGPTPYWQQRVVYQIDARLDEPTFTLRGNEQVRYYNNSPDTLHAISFHLYLNAFRPGSRWSDADSVERRRRFNDLKDPDFGFNHVSDVTIDGVAVQAIWPLAPDSTIVRFALPRALAPGDSMTVTMNWDARPSIPPRRQGRRGRSYDFAQWYPKVVVYDKYGWEEHALYPAGEFYGEFGDFFVKLDVPEDQVIGATGVPVCGDPGWRGANRDMSGASIRLGPDPEYGPDTKLPPLCLQSILDPTKTPDRKQVVWIARNVHNFAFSMSPDYRYEGGEWNGIQVHVLYQPGDEKTWGNGIVVNNTITTLKWLGFIFGPYPWPQMTVVHRIEGGGTEFPMMQMNGSPSLGLNLHEGGHTYLMGILANNEWREGWMDEGFTSFQTTWFEELQAGNDGAERNLEGGILLSDLDGESQPVSTVSEKFRDFNTYNNMIYSRGELFLHELRRMVGDSTMLEILHRYYSRWRLHHVDEGAFRAVAEEVSHRDLTTFFAQWLHDVVLTDYAIHSAQRKQTATGWQTTVEIARRAPGQFPIEVAVYGAADTAYITADGVAEHERIVIETRSKPRRVALDPFTVAHDWNMLNNRFRFGPLSSWFGRERPTKYYLDTWFTPQQSRDRLTAGLMPTAWYNTTDGVTIGLRSRNNYLGRFDQNIFLVSRGLRNAGARGDSGLGLSMTVADPTWWRAPNTHQSLNAFRLEGRAGAGVKVEREYAPHLGFGPTYTSGASAQWVATYDMRYLPATLWDDGGSAEAALWWGVTQTRAGWRLGFSAIAAGGVLYRRPAGGFSTSRRYDAEAYARPQLVMSARRALSQRSTLALRGYVAAVFSADPVLSQRRLFVAGADPYQTMSNPFIRSTGALLNREDCWCRWHTPGDGNLRGYNQALSTDRLASVNAELTTTLFRTKQPLLSRAVFVLFGDAGVVGTARGIGGIGDTTQLAASDRTLADAGAGLRLTQRIGATTWISRIDVPFYVSDPAYAFAHRLRAIRFDRLLVSFSPVIP